jgi:hypothetical protein
VIEEEGDVKAKHREAVPVYPILIAMYFVLALAADNGGQRIRPTDLARPLLASLGLVVVVWVTAGIATWNIRKGGFIAFLVTLAFGTFRLAYDPLDGILALRGDQVTFLFVEAWLLAIASFAVWRHRGELRGVSRYLNVVTILLAGFAGTRAFLGFGRPSVTEMTLAPATVPLLNPGPVAGPRPDIFLIVVDKYEASRELARNYGFDNGPFEAALRQRGFFVPQAARANYVHTMLALAAMLNMRYLDDFPKQFGADSRDWSLSYPVIENNQFALTLKRLGYRYIFLPTGFWPTRQSHLADEQIPSPSAIRPEFEAAWVNTTPIRAGQRVITRATGYTFDSLPYAAESADLLDWKFRQLAQMGGGPRPVFVFAHLALPHEPYLYWHDCRHRDVFWPANDRDVVVMRAYVEQIQCLNQKLLALIDSIQSRSSTPPVILIQADHGHGRFGRKGPGPVTRASPTQITERTAVFAAYALPGASRSGVWDSITPVNATRLVLRHYFAADLPSLPDATYWSSWAFPYRFSRVR